MTRSWLAFAIALSCMVAPVAVPSSAVADVVETPPGAISTAQVSIAMDNDWQFVGSDCLFIPLLATYGRADDTSIIGELTVTKPGSTATSNDGTFLVLPGDPVSGQVIDEVFVCPADGTGEYQLGSLIRAIQPTAEQSFALDPLTFWVRPAVSVVQELQVRAVKGGTRVVGRVEAADAPATGVVEVRIRDSATRRWSHPEVAELIDGRFDQLLRMTLRPGTRVKVTLTRCSWCTRTSAVGRVR